MFANNYRETVLLPYSTAHRPKIFHKYWVKQLSWPFLSVKPWKSLYATRLIIARLDTLKYTWEADPLSLSFSLSMFLVMLEYSTVKNKRLSELTWNFNLAQVKITWPEMSGLSIENFRSTFKSLGLGQKLSDIWPLI